MTMRNDTMQQAIEISGACSDTCIETMAYCLSQGGEHTEAAHIRLMMDCAEICRTASNFMLRGSRFHEDLCSVCADVCDECARDCARFAGDERMQSCAEVCRRCADACRAMVQQARAA